MNINFELLTFDYIIIAITILFICFGLWKGFVNSILSLLTWIGSIFITIFSYEYLSSFLNNLFYNINILKNYEQVVSILSVIISIPLIFLISLFILKRIRKVLSSDLDKQIMGIVLDKLFGFVYGIIFTYAIFSTLLYFTYNNDINFINNINNFLINNSNILNNLSAFNENILGYYFNSSNG